MMDMLDTVEMNQMMDAVGMKVMEDKLGRAEICVCRKLRLKIRRCKKLDKYHV